MAPELARRQMTVPTGPVCFLARLAFGTPDQGTRLVRPMSRSNGVEIFRWFRWIPVGT